MSRRTGRRKRSPAASPYATPTRVQSTLDLADELHLLTSLNTFDNTAWMFGTSPDMSNSMDIDMPYFDPSLYNDLNTTTTMAGGERDSISSSISSSSAFSAPDDDLDLLFGLPSDPSQTPQPAPHMLEPLPSTTPAAVTVKNCPTAQYGPATHSCITTALQLIADLRTSSTKRPCVQTDFSIDAELTSSESTRDIDAVLDNNRTALKHIGMILDCVCSNEQEVLIPVFLVAHQVLLWYEAALCIEPQSTASVMDRVVTSQVMMGNYCLDVDAQGLVRAHIILGELRLYTQPILMRLSHRNINNASLPANPSEGHGTEVIECYQRTLRAKLRAIVAKANSLKTV